MATGVGPIKQAFVRALRDIDDLKSAVGSDGFYEGIALTNQAYPFCVYTMVVSVPSRTFGSEAVTITTFDVWIVSDDQVGAHNLDQLLFSGMEDITLDFTGAVPSGEEPSTLLCRRLSSMSFVEIDDSGNKVYRIGGTYQIWTDRL